MKLTFGIVIRDGNIKRWIRNVLALTGSALILIGLKYDIYLMALLGAVVGAIGMYASQAAAVGVKPFESWQSKRNREDDGNCK
ncbi:hypothetical protein [Achromobacter sp. UMC71]|uniref:hypothetical protein n=1 Tax=Achromobacter sp. UMC71 TaxID=1862320 RepID=UPI001602264C|nr:hypothetical protein [Achromobacter sp. UMC71]